MFQQAESAHISADQLAIPKARQLATLVTSGLPFARFLCAERHTASGSEAVVVEVEVELGQKSVHAIEPVEPLAFIFDPRDEVKPEVWTLREGFPVTPHQNLRTQPEPRSLCLYEEPYSELKTRWSAFGFLERAREWLRLTARGELHQGDQPLEPLLGETEYTAILPHDFLASITGKDFLPTAVARASGTGDRFILVLPQPSQETTDFVLSPFAADPVQHGIITHQPQNLLQLQHFCLTASLDLVNGVRERIRRWKSGGGPANMAQSKLIICLFLPKLRNASGQSESRDIWLFATRTSILELGTALGILEVKSGHIGFILGNAQVPSEAIQKIEILPMRPTFALDASTAATLNGTPLRKTKIVAIGMGAVGSHVFDNLLKSGFGSWTLVDKDHLLPHNCARHVLDASALTLPKADAMRIRAANIIPDLPVTTIVADVLSPGEKAGPLNKALKDAEVILDMSASTAVAKHLGLDVKAQARRASVFLNPAGDTLVVMVEDSARTTPLDWLEMVYYHSLTGSPDFADHFKSSTGFRYSRSCGDITSRISQDLVALHSAAASHLLRTGLESSKPAVMLHRTLPDFSSKLHVIPVERPSIQTGADWTILTNPRVFAAAQRLRQSKLPNETGGVLLGSFDSQHRRIHVIDLLPSPSDSHEWPDLYIRGTAGLRNRIQEISNLTHNNIDYIGEWHSHPPRSSAQTSPTDRVALSKLAALMRPYDLPALMLIVAGANRHAFHLKQDS